MIKEVADRWAAELRSGNYAQTKGALHVVLSNVSRRPEGFCCLGVLCEIAVRDGIIDLPEQDPYEGNGESIVYDNYEGNQSLPGDLVINDFAGLKSDTGMGVTYGDIKEFISDRNMIRSIFGNEFPHDDYQTSLVDLNDVGVPFTTIADIVEKCWEKL